MNPVLRNVTCRVGAPGGRAALPDGGAALPCGATGGRAGWARRTAVLRYGWARRMGAPHCRAALRVGAPHCRARTARCRTAGRALPCGAT